MLYLAIAFAGGLGSLARYALDQSLPAAPFPLTTFLINILGSLLIGALYVLVTEKGVLPRDLGIVLMVGLLGGFTTFSAYALQTVLLVGNGSFSVAAIYFLASPVCAGLAAWGGIWAARTIA